MKTRSLGKEGLITSAIGLGCMGMSEFNEKGDDKKSIRSRPEGSGSRVTISRSGDAVVE